MTLPTVFMITGTGVHDPPELVFTIDWNECSRSTGIRVHDPPERAKSNFRFRCFRPVLGLYRPEFLPFPASVAVRHQVLFVDMEAVFRECLHD